MSPHIYKYANPMKHCLLTIVTIPNISNMLNIMEGESIEQNPPLPITDSNIISVATDDQLLMMNYPNSQALNLPTFTQLPTHHHQFQNDHQQYYPQPQQVPLDIDWVSLLSGSPTPTVASSSTSVANSGCGGGGDGGGPGGGGGGGESEGVINCMNNRSHKLGRGGVGGRRVANKKSTVPPRFAFHTRSVDDVLDDGYKWRKYGQKAVKNNNHPRSYYRCTYHTCNVKKQIQRLSKDTGVVVTTYEGIHNHPSEKLMETLTPLLRQLQFLSQF